MGDEEGRREGRLEEKEGGRELGGWKGREEEKELEGE